MNLNKEKAMILYFSGTGNSEYVAKRISRGTGEECIDLFEKLKKKDFSPIHSETPVVIVTPTYAWRIPRIVEDWIENTRFTGSGKLYFVLTCGENIGNAGKYLNRLCERKAMDYCGCIGIVMPENYIALFSSPTWEEALRIIEKAEAVIDKAISFIKKGERFPKTKLTLADNIESGIVNTVFYPLFVHAKKFYATDACISCGKCARVCPLENIELKGGRPVWGDSCTHCMACICRCPKEAIEYGRHSRGLVRYTCKKEI